MRSETVPGAACSSSSDIFVATEQRENTPYFLSMPKKVFNFELSSGSFSTPPICGALMVVSVDFEDGAFEGVGDCRFALEPDEDEAIISDLKLSTQRME